MKTTKDGVGVHSLTCNTSRDKKGVLELHDAELGQMTSRLIHKDIHKPKNKLVST
jgi:hypothetical protein